jgi:hypothetical protein
VSSDSIASELRQAVAIAQLDEACRIVVSELRSGIVAAQNAVNLLQWECRPERQKPLTDEQRLEFLAMAERGIKEAAVVIDQLLLEGLLRRLEARERERRTAQ